MLIVTSSSPPGLPMQGVNSLLWLDAASDALLFFAFICLFLLLRKLIRNRKDLPLSSTILGLFIFVGACGATHLLSAVSLWIPTGLPEGLFKLVAAISSVSMVFALRSSVPKLVQLPTSAEVQQAKKTLVACQEELAKRSAELKQICVALQASNELNRKNDNQFRQMADSMPQMVWTAGPEGAMEYFNEQWYSFSGFDRNCAANQSWQPLLHPDDIQHCSKAWSASVRSGLPYKEEFRFYDRSTATYRWHLGRASPIKNDAGNVIKWIGTCSDIDDYKRAEMDVLTMNSQLETRVAARTQDLLKANDELRRTQSWLQAILQSATEVSIMALDNSGIITFFNSGTERLVGYRAEEVVGKVTPKILYPPEQSEQRARQLSAELKRTVTVDEIFLAVNQPSESFVSESIYLHRDGTPIDVSLASSPMIDSKGERLGKLAIAVDMRPRKLLEQQLTRNNLQLQLQTQKAEEASQAKTHFLSMVSHEIRTPMNAILGMADLLWETQLDEGQRRYVEVFRRACTNLLALVNDILDLSKIESGRFELEHIDFDLRNVLELTLEMIRPKALAKGLHLDSAIAADVPVAVLGDPLRLQQILSNLLSNAVKFTDSGTITLSVRTIDTDPVRICFDVNDTGIGIPADKLESIFEDFTQAESSTTRRFGGTGLGLGICQRLIARMGGNLTVRSQLEVGSTFSFDIPFAAGSDKGLRKTDIATSLIDVPVLIVDDNVINRLVFADLCIDWGMKPVELDSAAAVLSTLQEASSRGEAFRLVIIDGLISQINGVQLAWEIRKLHPQLPILLITSDSAPGDQTKISNLGASEYAIKPVRRPELLRLIRKLLNAAETIPTQLPQDRTLRLLIAEDSEDNRFLLQEYLKSGSYDVTFVENGQLALASANAQTFDLILMDVQMPVMDGLTATTLIREAERTNQRPRVPILALTANAHTEDIALSRSAGCDGHVSKPIARQDLIATVQKHALLALPLAVAASTAMQIPAGLEDAAKRYIASRNLEIEQMKVSVEAADFEQVQRLAHNLKGSGTSYGFPDLTRLGGLIESSAAERNATLLSHQLLELSQHVQAAEIQLFRSVDSSA